MFFIEDEREPMRTLSKPRLLLTAFMGVGALLSGCVGTPPAESALRLSNDFGVAVNQDIAAQIADPDATAKEGPPPPSNGARAALAMTRYQHDAVIPPLNAEASGGSGGGSGGGGGYGAGAGAGMGAGAGASGGP
jgi:hypothetical protein